jgi:ribose transport system ATP-binding protein
VAYVSHNLGDVLGLADDVAVLRDGRVVAAGPRNEFDVPRLVALMVGRPLDRLYPPRTAPPRPEPLLEACGLSGPGVVSGVSFTLRRGEVLGVAGLMGSGRTELARVLFGLDPCRRGTALLDGKPLAGGPSRRIRRGLALVTEDRRDEGLLMEAGVEENAALAALPRFGRGPVGWLARKRLRSAVAALAGALHVECPSLDRSPVRTLSGGNQQKVVFAKWLLTGPSVFLLDEPTRGVDVVARYEIYATVDRLAARGAGVLFISSEVEELLGVCDRVLVLAGGKVAGCFGRHEFDRERVLRCMLGER